MNTLVTFGLASTLGGVKVESIVSDTVKHSADSVVLSLTIVIVRQSLS